MLQSEFFERTGENVTGDVYAKIENIYNNVSVDKDVFCAGWKKYKNDEFVADLMDAILTLANHAENERNLAAKFESEIARMKQQHENECKSISDSCTNQSKEFAKKIIRQYDNQSLNNIYNVIEEEYGFAFIIKSKREMGITLTDKEIDYLVSKL